MVQEYTQQFSKIEAELERWLPQDPDSVWAEKVFGNAAKNADAESIEILIAPAREILFRGGKRWRPLLMTLVCEALGGKDAAIPLSPVVEFSHNASLIHDDIEDNSDKRRGKPAIHKLFGVDVAINSGSFFYFLASSCIESFEHKNKNLIYRFWMECMRKLHLGQSMDINWHRNISIVPAIEEYFFMCTLKTGSLGRLAVELGAFAANAPAETAGLLGDAADTMGIGFQILDDVKNLTTGSPGKKRGDDMVEGKKSFPVLLYMHKFPEKQEEVFHCFSAAKQKGADTPEVDELIKNLSSAGVFEEAEEKGKNLIREAKDAFHTSSHAFLDNFIELIS